MKHLVPSLHEPVREVRRQRVVPKRRRSFRVFVVSGELVPGKAQGGCGSRSSASSSQHVFPHDFFFLMKSQKALHFSNALRERRRVEKKKRKRRRRLCVCAEKKREREREREQNNNNNNVCVVVLSINVDAATVQKHSQSDETVSVEEQGRFVQRNPTGVSGKSHARGRERRRKEASDRHRRVGPVESVQRVGREEQRVAGETERTVDGGESVMMRFLMFVCLYV